MSLLGPAVLISVGYMDPGNWATDLAGGSQFGYSLLWVLLASNLMALLLQHLSAKLGLATGLSYPQLCRARFPRPVAMFLWLTAEAAAIATDLAEFLGAALGFYLLLRIPLFEAALLTAVAVFGILGLYRFGYRWVEIVDLRAGRDHRRRLRPGGLARRTGVGRRRRGRLHPAITRSGRLPIAMGMLGATVMPHNLYLHSGVVLSRRRDDDEINRQDRPALAHCLGDRAQPGLAGQLGDRHHGRGRLRCAGIPIDSIEAAHETLTPLLGGAAAIGVRDRPAGRRACPRRRRRRSPARSSSRAFSNIRFGLFLRRAITVVPAIIVIAIGIDAFTILIVSQVALSIQLPFAIIPLVWLTSRHDVMGGHVNRRATTVAAAICGGVIVVLNVWLLSGLFFGM